MKETPSLPISSAQIAAATRVRNNISSGAWRLLENKCLCGDDNHVDTLLSHFDRYGLPFSQRLCNRCGIVRSSEILDEKALNEFYDTEYRNLYSGSEKVTSRFFEDQIQRGQAFLSGPLSNIPHNKRIAALEIGCGAGGILKAIQDSGWRQVTGIDLGAMYLDYGRQNGLELLHGDYRTLIADQSQNLIILSHVLEHLAHPHKELINISNKLLEGGYLLIEVPGLLSIHKSYRRIHHYFQGAHVYNFSLGHLETLLRGVGFEIITGNEHCTVLAVKRHSTAQPVMPQRALENPQRARQIGRYLRRLALLDRFHFSWLGIRLTLSQIKQQFVRRQQKHE